MAAQQKRHPEYPRSAAIDLTPLLGAVCTSPIPHPSTAHYHASLVPALATVLYVASWQAEKTSFSGRAMITTIRKN